MTRPRARRRRDAVGQTRRASTIARSGRKPLGVTCTARPPTGTCRRARTVRGATLREDDRAGAPEPRRWPTASPIGSAAADLGGAPGFGGARRSLPTRGRGREYDGVADRGSRGGAGVRGRPDDARSSATTNAPATRHDSR
jgi:hypothetical protein